MDEETFRQKRQYAGERKASMLRRSISNDYRARNIYLITLVTANRTPWFGRVAGSTKVPKGSPEYPHIDLSPLGEAVRDEWLGIPKYYPQIQILKLQMMPDHLHGIIFVKERLPLHLGKVISGFKAGCNRLFRSIVLHETPEGTPARVPYAFAEQKPAHTMLSPAPSQQRPPTRTSLLWETGYNDRILHRKGQLQRWYAYLNDNPYRLMLKRENRDLFRVHFNLRFGPYTFSAIGNRFLLQYLQKQQLQCSRNLTEEGIEAKRAEYLSEALTDTVTVSPAISKGEKAIMRSLMEAGARLILLQENGFTYLSKPSGSQLMEACAAGRLLILSPWEHHNIKQTIRRSQCLALNEMAKYIAEN